MTGEAGHVPVRAIQRKARSIVIHGLNNERFGVVTRGTGDFAELRLMQVSISVTIGALRA